MQDLFKLRDGSAPRFLLRDGPELSQSTHADESSQYTFVDDETSTYLSRQDYFERLFKRIPGDRLEEIIGGTADEAIEAIEAGRADDFLDCLLFAEREHDDRVSVVDAIAHRSDTLATQEAQEESTSRLEPSDVAG